MAERKFKDINVTVYSIKPPLIVVGWTFEDSVIPMSRYQVQVLRGESPQQMEPITGWFPGELYTEFEDRTPKLKDLHRHYFYQVQAKNKQTGITTQSKINTWEGDLDLVGLYVVEEHTFKFRHVSGIPVYIFKKNTEGNAKCPNCWDDIAKRVTRSNCTVCHGTGNYQGYYNPTYTWADPNPDADIIQITQWGRTQPSQTDMFFINYPRLTVGDLVFEILTEKRWKVSAVRDTEKRRTKMLQIVRLDLLTREEVEYTIEIPSSLKARALQELNTTKKIPEF